MDQYLREQVWQRAAACCEYCQMPQPLTDVVHEIDHIIAEKHRGPTTSGNLALACFQCNNHKGLTSQASIPFRGGQRHYFILVSMFGTSTSAGKAQSFRV